MFFYFFAFWATLCWSADPQTEALRHIEHAETWYRLSQATQGDYKALEHSQQAYETALSILEPLNDPQSMALKVVINKGLEETPARLDNAHDTFRNVLWPIWWIAKEDSTVEWYDDFFMLAVGNAWGSVMAQMDASVDVGRTPLIVRVKRNELLPTEKDDDGVVIIPIDGTPLQERLNGYHDEILTAANTSPYMLALSPSTIQQKLPADYDELHRFAAQPSPELLNRLHEMFRAKDILLVDVFISDEINADTEHPNIVRVNITTQSWSTSTGELNYTIYGTGLGQDISSRSHIALFWVLGLFAIAMGLVWLRTQLLNLPFSKKEALISGALSFLIGGTLGEFAGQFSVEYLQDWGMASYIYEGDFLTLPYLPVLIWPLVHGGVVMLGPIAVLGYTSIKFSDYIRKATSDPLKLLAIVGPAAQAGSVAFLFLTLVMGVPTLGILTALPLSFAAMICASVLATPVAHLLEGDSNRTQDFLAIGFAVLGLAILLPLGLYHNNAILATLIACVLSAISWKLGQKAEQIEEDVEEAVPESFQPEASIDFPKYLDVWSLSDFEDDIHQGNSICISGQSRMGVSRQIQELKTRLKTIDPMPASIHVELTANSGHKVEPFELIQALYTHLNILEKNLNTQLNTASSAADAFGSFEGLMGMFPGVGLISEMVGEDAAPIPRERVIQDGANALIMGLKKKNTAVLFIEGYHFADESSIEVLQRALPELPCLIIFGHHDELSEDQAALVKSLHSVERLLSPISNKDAERFLIHCNLHDMPEDISHSLNGIAQGCIGHLHHLVMTLRDHKLIQEQTIDEQTIYRPIDDLSVNTVWNILPKDIQENERQRIKSLPEEFQLPLICAALCGPKFTLRELALGLNQGDLQTAAVLQKIEDYSTPPVIEDIPNHPGYYRFTNSMTQLALSSIQKYNTENGAEQREFARAFHGRIIDSNDRNRVDLDRQFYHALHAGISHVHELMDITADLVEKYAKQYAWSDIHRVLQHIARERLSSKNKAALIRIDRIHARALRFIGGQNNRNIAIGLLDNQIYTVLSQQLLSPHDRFQIVFAWCEVLFEEKQASDLERLLERSEHFMSAITVNESPLIALTFRLYRSIAENFLHKTDIIQALDELRIELNTLSPSSDLNYLRGIVLQNLGNRYWYDRNPPEDDSPEDQKAWKATHWTTVVKPIFDQAIQSKEDCHDIQGLAIAYGSQAHILWSTFNDLDGAEELLQKDLKLLEDNGMLADVSSVRNRLSMIAHTRAGQAEDESQRQQYLALALIEAQKAFEHAVKLEREIDTAFAGEQYIKMLFEQTEVDQAAIDQAGEILAAPELWAEVQIPFLRAKVLKWAQELSQSQNPVPTWVTNLMSVLHDSKPQ